MTQTNNKYEPLARLDSVLDSIADRLSASARTGPLTVRGALPKLPPSVPLPPQEELEEFDIFLQAAMDDLETLTTNANAQHDLATTALRHLAHMADMAACIATSWPEFWSMLVHTAKLLCTARLSMSVSVKNVLAGSLEQLARHWNEEQGRWGWSRSTAELARVAGESFDDVLDKKRLLGKHRLKDMFVKWLESHCQRLRTQSRSETESRADSVWSAATESPFENDQGGLQPLRVLTTGLLSPALSAALTHAVSVLLNLNVYLNILSTSAVPSPSELRPTIASCKVPRLHTTTYSFSAVGAASQDIDILLLDAACIDSQGKIQSTTGALGAAACIKTLSPHARVAALGSVDCIVLESEKKGRGSRAQEQGNCEALDGTAVSSEWIPAQFVDEYVTDAGLLDLEEVKRLAKENDKRKRIIFGV